MIDVLASAPHYADHLAAVFGALPESARGSFMTTGPVVADRVKKLGYRPSGLVARDRPVLTASYGDMKRAERVRRERIALMEHGAGQSYGGRRHLGDHGSYAGGQDRDGASLFLHPGEHPAQRDRKAYPKARVEVVGSPHLDTLPRKADKGRVVAVSFHFNGPLVRETKNAWPWAFPAVVELSKRYTVLGHAHPMLFDRVLPHYRKYGIEAVRDFGEVCRRADLYVCDNSSTLFAFAATGRPVVVLNPPWYDRRVVHGLRFWDAATVGVNCDRIETLADCIDAALDDPAEQQQAREAALDLVYAYREGAAKRAADVLMEWAA